MSHACRQCPNADSSSAAPSRFLFLLNLGFLQSTGGREFLQRDFAEKGLRGSQTTTNENLTHVTKLEPQHGSRAYAKETCGRTSGPFSPPLHPPPFFYGGGGSISFLFSSRLFSLFPCSFSFLYLHLKEGPPRRGDSQLFGLVDGTIVACP